MTQQPPMHSGSRWEPDAPPVGMLPVQPTPSQAPAPAPSLPTTSSGLRGRIASVAAAVALVAVGGLGGFALVSSLTGDDDGTGAVQTTVDDDTQPGPDGFPGGPGFDGDEPRFGGGPGAFPDDPTSTTDGDPA